MSKNDENQPLLDKDEAKTDYSVEGENVAGGKILHVDIFSLADIDIACRSLACVHLLLIRDSFSLAPMEIYVSCD